MVDLSTTYLGLDLKHPVIVSPSPMTESLDNIRQMEDAGAAAIVMHSLFEEQITLESVDLDRYLSLGVDSFSEALSFFPDMRLYNMGPDGYLEHLARAKEAVAIPVIASLNGYSTGGWIKYAQAMEQAGADALELNIYYIATDPKMTGAEIEAMYLDLVHNVKSSLNIPVAVKLSPYFSAMANMAARFEKAGADGLVLFNRFYQPDFDLETLEVTPSLKLSDPHELLLRLRWAAILRGQVGLDMAITGGVHTAEDVVKSVMAGANAAMMTSAVYRHGIDYLSRVCADLRIWLEDHEYESIRQMHGSMSQHTAADPGAFERANYMKVIRSYAMPSR